MSRKALRSSHWFKGVDKTNVVHRGWMKAQGFPAHLFDGRPVIGICNSWSELTPCNSHFRDLAERVKYGVYEAGGFPLEFPVTSLGESNMRPSAMMFRNLVSMDVEESLRANPIDGVVLLAGCDKSSPALLMGAASVNLPTVVVSSGPMYSTKFEGRSIGSGTDLYKMSEEFRAGKITEKQFRASENAMCRSPGTCNTMGTASTMAAIVEVMGLALPGNTTLPAMDSGRRSLAHMSGSTIVDLVKKEVNLSKILTKKALHNAIRLVAAIGGSTNAVIHLKAISARIGIDLTLEDWDQLSRNIPTIVNLQPSGAHFMHDLFEAGGMEAVIKQLCEEGVLEAVPTLTGKNLLDNNADVKNSNNDVIRPMNRPICLNGGIAVIRGNLAPTGAVIKVSAATPNLLNHSGKAVVFKSYKDYKERIEDPDLDIDENSVLVLQNCGPVGYPGMPEVGNMGLPTKLLEKGITDIIRISDARMSGTAYGTVILHISPEAAIGGPLSLVKDGDLITLDVDNRSLDLKVSDEDIEQRRKEWSPAPKQKGGYEQLFVENVLQADRGCDFSFLVGCRGSKVAKDFL